MHKSLLSSTGLLLAVALFIAFIIVVNGNLTSARLDLTEDRLYTLSEGSMHIIESVQQPITLRFYFSEQVAQALPNIRAYAQRVRELLREYELASDGMIRVLAIDPKPFTHHEKRAEQYGLQAIPIEGEDDPLYFGLAGTNELNGLELIRFFQTFNEDRLEYDITKLIHTLSSAQRINLGVLSALPVDGEQYDPLRGQLQEGGTPPWPLMAELRQMFTVSSLPTDIRRIPGNLDALVVIHPKEFPEPTLYAIDQYVLNGGKLIVFVDPFAELDVPARDPDNPMAASMANRASNLDELFRNWGFQRSPTDVVADRKTATKVDFGARTNHQPIDYVLWQGLEAENLNADHPVTAALKRMHFATVGHFVVDDAAATDITPLIWSSSEAMLVDRRVVQFRNDPVGLLTRYEAGSISYPYAIHVQGTVNTAFPDGARDASGQQTRAPNHLDTAVAPIQVIAVADVDLLNARFWVQEQDFFGDVMRYMTSNNVDFLTNAVEYLTVGDGLMRVRTRSGFSRPFTVVQDLQREAERKFRTKERALQQALQETQQRIARMQSQGESEQILTPEQELEIAEYREQEARMERDLREVRANLRRDIDRLDTWLKFINIGLVPILVALLALLSAWLKIRKRARARFQQG